MRKFTVFAALAAALAGNVQAAPVLSDADRADLKCVILYADYGNSLTDPTREDVSGVALLIGYFSGRIYQRNPSFDLLAALTPELKAAARAKDAKDVDYCSREGEIFSDRFSKAAAALDN